MKTDRQLVEDIRRMFLDGATPSRLVRYVVANAPIRDDDIRLRRLVQDYFSEAFGIFLRRIPLSDSDLRNDFSSAGLNQLPLHRIVQNKSDWLNNRQAGSWLDDLEVTESNEWSDSVDLSSETELAGVLDHLDDSATKAIKRWISNINFLYEQVQILAALAERLQEKIDQLEAGQATEQNVIQPTESLT